MSQTVIAIGLVAAAVFWIAWTYLPRRLRKKMTGGKCGPDCGCGG
jgi:hypothetical protein